MRKRGVLLINLGTPDHSDPRSVRRYLTQFLNDARVIDLPFFVRWPLVNLLIVPSRYKKTAHAYQQIWNEEGSPLLSFSQKFKTALADKLGSQFQVEIGMRYGNPSIASAIKKLKEQCDSVITLPLFPQYSSAATGSAIAEFNQQMAKEWNIPAITIKNDFYADAGFIKAYAQVINEHLKDKKIDLLLFSYHGLPERHIHKSQCVSQCNKNQSCPLMTENNRYCYRAQCYATSQAIAKELQLANDQFFVSFQSRLGRTPWIKPYTDLILSTLIERGIKHIAMVSPSFVADCLETLEEINIRTRAAWHKLGGETFTFIPCLNHSPAWVDAVAEMVTSSR